MSREYDKLNKKANQSIEKARNRIKEGKFLDEKDAKKKLNL